MTDIANEEALEPPKASKLPLIIGIVLGILGAGGGYFVTSSGLLSSGESPDKVAEEEVLTPIIGTPKIAFVPLDPLTVSLQSQGSERYLRFRAELEVEKTYTAEVELIRPRIIDVLNGYLRALEIQDLETPAALTRLRAQMLRRVQIVAGPNRVKDLLIMEFVVN